MQKDSINSDVISQTTTGPGKHVTLDSRDNTRVEVHWVNGARFPSPRHRSLVWLGSVHQTSLAQTVREGLLDLSKRI